MKLLGKPRGYVRYAIGLRRYLKRTISLEEARAAITDQLKHRDESFLSVVGRAIYANASSPYRRLLDAAGIELGDVRALVTQNGLEGALDAMRDAGVYVTQDEFKGRAPVRRKGVEFAVTAADFDNPLVTVDYEGRSGGSSSGRAQRVQLDLNNLENDAEHLRLFLDAHGIYGRPLIIWRPSPPDTAGIHNVLRYTKIGMTPQRWFAQNGFARGAENPGAAVVIATTLAVGRLAKRSLPKPEYVPSNQAIIVAHELAEMTRRGTPAILESGASQGVRVCLAAAEAGIDISGTVFRVGGEPYTQAKADAFTAAGGRGINRYSMVELGNIGLHCATPQAVDDVHMLTSKIAIRQRTHQVGGTSETVQELLYTTLSDSTAKLMLNTETGDYGKLEERDCGCALNELGFRTHLSGVRAYDKLTSEGVTFVSAALHQLVESILPARFGGASTDYQLVEEEEGSLTKVSVVVSPRVGSVDEAALINTVVAELRGVPRGGRLMAQHWVEGNTLRVLRREPFANSAAKVLPLHVMRKDTRGETGPPK